ncbi:hypothetical protein [Martelella mediterranea]|uniref:Uncharacterized protein n=1 Tax=Martelella mediterranea DSM 17316 TaxID=1122214 RepID=A0A1U9Z2X5_9HYPH|nr:hypothetical protein [Martelella mediterranea]AQZ52028.1 hypothetical protein Mame_02703 [Martelella mediterranea DSM 17316]
MANENIKSPMGADEAEIKELGSEELQAASGGSMLMPGIALPDGLANAVANGVEDVGATVKNVVETGAADVAKAADWVGDAASKAGSALETGVKDVAKGIWDASADWC